MRATNLMLVVAVVLAGCSENSRNARTENEAVKPSVKEIAAAYQSYAKMTDSEVFVNPELAMLCRGATQQEVADARLKFGPHAHTAILIYMNEPAAKTFSSGANSYPVGSVIVKRKKVLGFHDPLSGNLVHDSDNGVGGMVKRQRGFDPAHGDWEYFYFENPAQIESGKISSCVECHQTAKGTDYVFGSWRK